MGYRLNVNWKNRKKKQIAIITVVAFILSLFSNTVSINTQLVGASENRKFVIDNITANDKVNSNDDIFELSRSTEKLNDNEIKVSLDIKVNKDNIPVESIELDTEEGDSKAISNIFIAEALTEGFNLINDSVKLEEFKEREEDNVDLTNSLKDKEYEALSMESGENNLSLNLKDVSYKELRLSYVIAINSEIKALENLELFKESSFKYIIKEGNEEQEMNSPNALITIREVALEMESKDIEAISEEIEKNEDIKETIDQENTEILKEGQESFQDENTSIDLGDIVSEEETSDEIGNEGEIIDETLIGESLYVPMITEEEVVEPISDNFTTVNGNVELRKTAIALGDDKYQITLNVSGTPKQVNPPTGDIVLVIDKSGSMEDKIATVKNAAKNFCEKILEGNPTNIRIGIVTYDYSGTTSGYGNYNNDSRVACDFTSDLSKLTTTINSINAKGGTNTEAGIKRADELITPSKADKKYVVLFTDGLPTVSNGKKYSNNNTDTFISAAQTAYSNILENNSGLKFYSLGLFTNANNTTKNKAINFLKTIQNVIAQDDFAAKYYTQDLNSINSIFTDIGTEIRNDINKVLAKDVNISDTITEYFTFVADTVEVTGDVKGEVTITNTNNKDGEDVVNVTIPEIGENGATITFTVEAKDPYFSANNIPTNIEANIDYTEPTDDTKHSGIFPVPTVNIEPKMAKIDITKYVENLPTEGEDADKEFKINIERVKDSGDTPEYLNDKIEKTITKAELEEGYGKVNLEYRIVSEDVYNTLSDVEKQTAIIAGHYNIKEVDIPTNYINESIVINDGSFNNNNANFTVDKNNKEISIKVNNRYTLTNNLILNKTATDNGDGTFEIALNVKKKASDVQPSEKEKIDVVFAIDASNSMSGKWNDVSTQINNIASALINNSEIEARVGVVTFSNSIDNSGNIQKGSDNDATVVSGLSNNTTNISNALQSFNTFGSSGGSNWIPIVGTVNYVDPTNVQAGLNKANSLLTDANTTKYIILFTDGPTTLSNAKEFSIYKSDFDNFKSDTVATAKTIKDSGIEIISLGQGNNTALIYSNDWVNKQNPENNNISMLSSITSAAWDTSKYFKTEKTSGGANSLSAIFTNAKAYIESNISASSPSEDTSIIENATVTDIVTDIFDIVSNGYGDNVDYIITPNDGSSLTQSPKYDSSNKSNNILSWSGLKIDNAGFTIKFKVKPKDEYHAENNVFTNVEAKVVYDNNTEYFNKPTVNLGIRGSLTVTKNLIGETNSEQKFEITVQGGNNNESYTFNLAGGDSETKNVILKDTNSVINVSGQTMTIGTYTVTEVNIPSGYEFGKMTINDKVLENGATFELNKGNNSININVTNIVVPTINKTATSVEGEEGVYEIELKVNNIFAKNVVITDEVTPKFDIVDNGYGQGKTSVVTIGDEVKEIAPTKTDNKTLTWSLGDVPASEGEVNAQNISIKFKVKVVNDYIFGEFDTNVDATLSYTHSESEETVVTHFNKPTVTIEPKVGRISITKMVAEVEGIMDESFNISLLGTEGNNNLNQRYTMNVNGNSTEDIEFYLKDIKTDVSLNEANTSINYMNIGSYKVEELIPMNYSSDIKVEYKYSESADWETLTTGSTFEVSKKTPNIYIRVTNTKVNDKYWYDNSKVENKLKYTAYTQSAARSILNSITNTLKNIFN